MDRFRRLCQTVTKQLRRVRNWDRHRWGHLALAVVHGVTGCVLAASAAMPEAVCAWIAAVVYAVLSGSTSHRGSA